MTGRIDRSSADVAMLGIEKQLLVAESFCDSTFCGKPAMPFGTGWWVHTWQTTNGLGPHAWRKTTANHFVDTNAAAADASAIWVNPILVALPAVKLPVDLPPKRLNAPAGAQLPLALGLGPKPAWPMEVEAAQ